MRFLGSATPSRAPARLMLLTLALTGVVALVFPRLLEPKSTRAPAHGAVAVAGEPRIDLGSSVLVRRAAPTARPEDAAGFGLDFVRLPGHEVPPGTFWVRFSVENPSAQAYAGQLALRHPLAEHLTVFRLDGPDLVLVRGGTRLHRTLTSPIELAPRSEATFLAHLDVPHGGLQLELWSPTALADALARGEWVLGIVFGLMLALTIYYGAVALATRDETYLPFMAFLGALVAANYVYMGFAYAHWGDIAPTLSRAVWPAYALMIAALSWLLRHFLDLSDVFPRLAECFRGLELGLFASLVLLPLGYEPPVLIARLMASALILLGIGLSLVRARQGAKHNLLIAFGWIPLLLVPLTGLFSTQFGWAGQVSREVMQMTAMASGVLCLAFAFAERVATGRAARDRALRESEERYAYAAAGTNDGLFDWDLASDSLFLSPRFYDTVRHPEGSLVLRPERMLALFHEDEQSRVQREMARAFKDESCQTIQLESRIRSAKDRVLWIHLRALLVRDEAGRVTRLVGSVADIHSRKLHELKLQHEAFNDDITGLPNRARVSQHLEALMGLRDEDPSFAFAVLFIDLDRFKNVNDSLGHVVGDRLLATLGRRLSLVARDGDLVGRLGGDEFVMVIAGRVKPEDAERVARRVLEALEAPVVLEGIEVRSSASIGITHSDVGYASPQLVFADADVAMYEAKQQGKGRYVSFDSQMRERAKVRLSLEAELRQAIERDELELFYQPIVNTDDERLAGFEALIRWHHPQRGMVSPGLFIPVAEETGLIRQIGRYALWQAALQLSSWRETYPEAEDWYVTVNVSPAQFGHKLLAEVAEVLEETNLPADRLRLEITEGLFIGDSGAAQDEMRRLVDFGVKFSLDDFGTGYSSLSYLHRLPFETLKIDRSFVMRLLEDEQSEAIVKSVLALAQGVGMATVAEGVETAEVAERLRELGATYFQGYFFGRPEPASKIEARMDEENRARSA